ncbi:hypothetical protein AB0L53_54635 [Nonomuraea sp. NPDC052129]|uniref:hypothetical protein n=1 Tax=Nonomuraea sp. NPDC052129 TaxID=3154651 RepID=UPI00343F78C2
MNPTPIRRYHRGFTVEFHCTDKAYTTEYLAGYTAALDWFKAGAPVVEAEALAEVYRTNKPGGEDYDAAPSLYLDAMLYPGFLSTMNSRQEAYERKFGPRFQVQDGKELAASFMEDYGGTATEWAFPERSFLLVPSRAFDDGLLTAVAHVLGRV